MNPRRKSCYAQHEPVMWFRLLISVVLLAPGLRAAEPVSEVPFEFVHNQIVLETWVNEGGPFRFVLDTGTHAATIDVELATRLGLPLGTVKKQGTGAGTRRTAAVDTICSSLRVGSYTARNVPATALGFGAVSTAIGRKLDGVLGSAFLDRGITQIDYFHRRVRFYSQSPFSPDPRPPDSDRRFAVPMRFHEKSVLPVIEDCAINGTPMPLTVDTGSSFGLILFPRAVRALRLEDLARSGTPLDAAGYRGKVRFTKGWVRSLRLHRMDLGAIEVAYVESGYGDLEDPNARAGNLGNAVLQDFTVTLDYVNRVLVLESNEE